MDYVDDRAKALLPRAVISHQYSQNILSYSCSTASNQLRFGRWRSLVHLAAGRTAPLLGIAHARQHTAGSTDVIILQHAHSDAVLVIPLTPFLAIALLARRLLAELLARPPLGLTNIWPPIPRVQLKVKGFGCSRLQAEWAA